MLDNNWVIIDGFSLFDVLKKQNILSAFMNSDKKRILFSHYFFDLDDCDGAPDYSKDQCISEEFQYFKIKTDTSVDYDKISDEVISLLYKEYCRLYKISDESVKEELYRKFFNDEIDFFDEEFIYSVKEFIARETSKPNKERFNFINERKIFENNINISYRDTRLSADKDQRKLKYVWYEPKSKEDLFDVVNFNSCFFSCIITEDIENFDEYLYAFDIFEENDFLLAINDRVGDFESRVLPKIQGFLSEENIVLSENEYIERSITRY